MRDNGYQRKGPSGQRRPRDGWKNGQMYNFLLSLRLARFPLLLVLMSLGIVASCQNAGNVTGGHTPYIPEHSLGLPEGVPPDYFNLPVSYLPGDSVPYAVNLGHFMPQVRSQGTLGSCTAWATAYALTSYYARKAHGWVDDRSDHFLSPMFLYSSLVMAGATSCRGGVNIFDALQFLRNHGCCTWQRMPYTDQGCPVPSNEAQVDAERFKLVTVARLDPQNIFQIKKHLRDGVPVVIAMPVGSAFDSLNINTGNVIYDHVGEYMGRHAVCVIGYNDSFGGFRIMNSWGTKWGDYGLCWMPYGFFGRTVDQVYVAWDSTSLHLSKPSFAPR